MAVERPFAIFPIPESCRFNGSFLFKMFFEYMQKVHKKCEKSVDNEKVI